MPGALIKRGERSMERRMNVKAQRHIGRRKPYEDGSKDWSDVLTSQGEVRIANCLQNL